MSSRFVAPRFDRPVDVEGHIARLPSNATCKGMFFRDLFALATSANAGSASEVALAAGIENRRYLPFLDYPMADNLRLTVEIASRVHPDVPLGEGLRRIGKTSFQTFLGSHIGRVLVLAASHDLGAVLMLAPRAFRLVMNFGVVTTERTNETTVVARCHDLPAFVETYQVGTLEGVFAYFGVRGRVLASIDDLANGALEAQW